MNNADSLQRFEISLRSGWKDKEKLMLWDEVKKAQGSGAPLKRVFETVAHKTGRKPNSVRNYYYMKVKETGEITQKPSSFTPFTKEEIYMLLRTLLAAGARGESIRGAALRLAGGDKTLMLRYQNKYRSLIKSGRPIVEQVMADMSQANEACLNPYIAARNGAQKEDGRMYIPESVVDALMASGVDIQRFIKGLAKVASLAQRGKEARREMQMIAAQNESIKNENEMLSNANRKLKIKLQKETERSTAAKTLIRQLLTMSRATAQELSGLAGIGEWIGDESAAGADAL